MKKVILTTLALFLFSFAALGHTQTPGLPKIKKGESYTSVRKKMIRAGWKPYHRKDADICDEGDKRCIGRPEMSACSGAGLGNCEFLWKRRGKTVAIFTLGENAAYDGFRLQ